MFHWACLRHHWPHCPPYQRSHYWEPSLQSLQSFQTNFYKLEITPCSKHCYCCQMLAELVTVTPLFTALLRLTGMCWCLVYAGGAHTRTGSSTGTGWAATQLPIPSWPPLYGEPRQKKNFHQGALTSTSKRKTRSVNRTAAAVQRRLWLAGYF